MFLFRIQAAVISIKIQSRRRFLIVFLQIGDYKAHRDSGVPELNKLPFRPSLPNTVVNYCSSLLSRLMALLSALSVQILQAVIIRYKVNLIIFTF